ncbi:hypothetical protein [Natronolimnohabitans innermongolicus]|nr:hypothetical protein [Natronolimnohabitans innermongolicus]
MVDGDSSDSSAIRRSNGGENGREERDPAQRVESAAESTAIEFLDCARVRVTGEWADVVLGATFEAEDGETGTVVDSVGAVEGERTIDAAAAFDLPSDGTVLESVELFETGPGMPGLGAEHVENPSLEACHAEQFGDETDATEGVEFLDCETVRVTRPAGDAMLSVLWWDENGWVGTITEPVGSVADDRTISATEAFGEFAHGPIVTGVELFEGDTPLMPGGGDVFVSNPETDDCLESVREAAAEPDELESVDLD